MRRAPNLMTTTSDTAPEPYSALITLTPPEAEGQLVLHLRLEAGANIASGGQRKALRDCTLAELQAYADELEKAFWTEHKDKTLADLLADANLAVDIQVEPSLGEISAETLLDQIILLAPPATETPPAETTPPPVAAPEAAEPEIAVAASEPIHPEKEATQPLRLPITPTVRTAGLLRRMGHPTDDAVDILIDESAFNTARAHSLTSLNREVAGMLIGPPPEKQPDKRYVVHITDALIARHTKMSGASVTYTPESWRDIHEQIGQLYPSGERVIVGWYHTHPGFNIFLSNMDLFIHMNFFTQVWHVALVLDPRAQTAGFFCWDRALTRVRPYQFPWPDWLEGAW